MKALLVSGAALGVALVLCGQAPPADPLLQALRDEVERSRKLTITNLEPPYFIQYVVDDEDAFSVSASLGGVVSRRRSRFRSPAVQVRVGDYKSDNTNFAGGGFGGSRYALDGFPIDDDYMAMRRHLWLETDSAYKAAVEALSRKRASQRNVTQNEQLDDFAHAEPLRRLGQIRLLTIDEDAWTDRVRALSAVFTRFPEVKYSAVELEASDGGYYVVNSEGTEVREPERVTFVRARAQAQAADGSGVRDAITIHAFDIANMPAQAELERQVAALAQNVTALAHASKGEDYNGPVLFEGAAGAQIFAEVLGRNLAAVRRQTGGRGGASAESELDGRIGARVLPESFDVTDDPTVKEWRGRPLFGSYGVDREGVEPKPLHLVEKGVLKGYLLTRQPVHGFEGSNGHGRLPGGSGATAGIGNLFVSSTEAVPAAELKKKLIELIQARGKDYGILVRKMDFPSSGSIDEVRRMLSGSQGGRPVSMPILVYKVFPDGREEMVRGLRFRGMNARSLKDILAAGDDAQPFDFMDSPQVFALIGGSSYTSEACVVAPSILIDDLELHAAEEELPKLPIVPAPELAR
ncbi:MAG: metallopeptidase TldD-related protein [Bryobacteraceae bacterium]